VKTITNDCFMLEHSEINIVLRISRCHDYYSLAEVSLTEISKIVMTNSVYILFAIGAEYV